MFVWLTRKMNIWPMRLSHLTTKLSHLTTNLGKHMTYHKRNLHKWQGSFDKRTLSKEPCHLCRVLLTKEPCHLCRFLLWYVICLPRLVVRWDSLVVRWDSLIGHMFILLSHTHKRVIQTVIQTHTQGQRRVGRRWNTCIIWNESYWMSHVTHTHTNHRSHRCNQPKLMTRWRVWDMTHWCVWDMTHPCLNHPWYWMRHIEWVILNENYGSLLQKSPIKEMIFCQRGLQRLHIEPVILNESYWMSHVTHTHESRKAHIWCPKPKLPCPITRDIDWDLSHTHWMSHVTHTQPVSTKMRPKMVLRIQNGILNGQSSCLFSKWAVSKEPCNNDSGFQIVFPTGIQFDTNHISHKNNCVPHHLTRVVSL